MNIIMTNAELNNIFVYTTKHLQSLTNSSNKFYPQTMKLLDSVHFRLQISVILSIKETCKQRFKDKCCPFGQHLFYRIGSSGKNM